MRETLCFSTLPDNKGGISRVKCKGCGEEFQPTHGNQKYCSNECRLRQYRFNRVSIIKNCKYCGSEFQFDDEGSSRKYCSRECIRKQTNKNQKIYYRDHKEYYNNRYRIKNPPYEYKSLICPFCKSKFIQTYHLQKYCSKECQKIAADNNRIHNRMSKDICQEVYNKKNDPDSVFYDPNFIEDLTGVTCEIVKKERDQK